MVWYTDCSLSRPSQLLCADTLGDFKTLLPGTWFFEWIANHSFTSLIINIKSGGGNGGNAKAESSIHSGCYHQFIWQRFTIIIDACLLVCEYGACKAAAAAECMNYHNLLIPVDVHYCRGPLAPSYTTIIIHSLGGKDNFKIKNSTERKTAPSQREWTRSDRKWQAKQKGPNHDEPMRRCCCSWRWPLQVSTRWSYVSGTQTHGIHTNYFVRALQCGNEFIQTLGPSERTITIQEWMYEWVSEWMDEVLTKWNAHHFKPIIEYHSGECKHWSTASVVKRSHHHPPWASVCVYNEKVVYKLPKCTG